MSESLREQLAANLDKITTREADEDTPAAPEVVDNTPAPAATPTGDAGAPPPSKIAEAPKADRPRDDEGRFAKAPKEQKTAAAPAKPGTATPPLAAGTQPQAAAAAPRPKPLRPDSWKKDYWGHWDKLVNGQPLSPEEALALAEYNVQREQDFRRGVATYNQEWQNAKPIMDAIAPFLPILQQHGVQPGQWIQSLGNAHQRLVTGSPEQKLQMFAYLAQQYGVPVAALTDQAAQQQYLAAGAQGQNFQGQPQLPPGVITREEAARLFQEQFNSVRSQEDIQRFAADTEKYPYFEELRETMARRLESGLSDDLQSAYEGALRDPRHSNIWDAIQEQKRAREAEANAKAEAERLAKAKAKAVSTRSATPTAPAGGQAATDRRSQIAEALEARMGGGRV